jgi:hypothetical protein
VLRLNRQLAFRGSREAHRHAGRLERERWVSEAGVVGALLLLGVLAPAFVAVCTHSLGLPIGDDWAFRRVLFSFVRTGRYRLVGWGSMTLVGQVLWGAIFVGLLGAHPWVPSLAVAVLAAGALAAAYLFARGQLSRHQAVASCLLVVALPGFALSTSSFMTDVPAFAGEIVCLLLGACGLRREGRARLIWLTWSMVAGLWAFSVREFAVVAPLAVLAASASIGATLADRRLVAGCVGAALLLIAGCSAIYFWTAGLPGAQPKHLALPGATAGETLAGAYFTLSFMVSPLLPGVVRRRRLWREPAAYAGTSVALGLGAVLLVGHHPVFIGNYLSQRGVGGGSVLVGTRPVLFPPLLWRSARALALVAGAALAGVLAEAFRAVVNNGGGLWALLRGVAAGATKGGDGVCYLLTSLFTWASVVLLGGYDLFVQAPFWDRYLWPVAFGAALVLARNGCGVGRFLCQRRPASTPRSEVAVAVLTTLLGGLLGMVASTLTLNADAFDAARWSAGEALQAMGCPAQEVDAGFEWVGSHAREGARPGRVVNNAPAYETWYYRMFPNLKACGIVSSTPVVSRSLHLVGTVKYNELAFAIPERLFLYAYLSSHWRSCLINSHLEEGEGVAHAGLVGSSTITT